MLLTVVMKAAYAGSFDPLTNGHLDIIQRASKVFDELRVVIAVNPSKSALFSSGRRALLVYEACKDLTNVTVEVSQGDLLVNYCKSNRIDIIVRGLRAVSDFESELAQAHTNHKLDPKIDTFFLVTQPENSFISSSMVKEISKLGGDVSPFVPPNVVKALSDWKTWVG
jgi:pantetheine-phosphate adenylyltransferase